MNGMSDLLRETRLKFSELASQEGVNCSTVWRWSLRGVRGVKLESFSIGAKRFTTAEAFVRFVNATTAAAQGSPSAAPIARTSRQQAAAVLCAERSLSDAGV